MEPIHAKNARVFKALCDEKRLAILELLRSGERCACVLIDRLDVGQSTLSYHMKILCESGIVESRQEGKWTHYRLSETGSRYAAALLTELTTPYAAQTPDKCSP
ncbi:MAG: transcriptional regulator [Clostridium sp. SCN 57-10]|nr:MAG: transcriptional regulator [Clostridium sp. SCN 57-10]